MSMKKQSLCDYYSSGEGADKCKFNTTIDIEKRGEKRGKKIRRETKNRNGLDILTCEFETEVSPWNTELWFRLSRVEWDG